MNKQFSQLLTKKHSFHQPKPKTTPITRPFHEIRTDFIAFTETSNDLRSKLNLLQDHISVDNYDQKDLKFSLFGFPRTNFRSPLRQIFSKSFSEIDLFETSKEGYVFEKIMSDFDDHFGDDFNLSYE